MVARFGFLVLALITALITVQNSVYMARGHYLHLAPMLLVVYVAWAVLRESGPPRAVRVFWPLALATAACAWLELAFDMYKRKPFDEDGPLTLLSVVILTFCALTAFSVWKSRRKPGPLRIPDPSTIWLIIAVGFVFLALDEKILIHEGLDRLFHKTFHVAETGWTSRLDDMIVGLYGVAGLGVLWFYLPEIRRFPQCGRLLLAGFGVMFLQVAADAVSDRPDFCVWLLGQELGVTVQIVTGYVEEISKVMAEVFFVTGFSSALYQAKRVIA